MHLGATINRIESNSLQTFLRQQIINTNAFIQLESRLVITKFQAILFFLNKISDLKQYLHDMVHKLYKHFKNQELSPSGHKKTIKYSEFQLLSRGTLIMLE